MVLQPTNEQGNSKTLGQMKNKKSNGYNGFSNEIPKSCSPIVEHYLAKVVNKCILEEALPDCLKKSKVLPLSKRGDKTQPDKNKSIRLLSPLTKIFEKNLLKRMMKFCDKQNILASTRFGIRPKTTCIQKIAAAKKAIHFGRGRPENIAIEDRKLDYKSTCKYLGFHIYPQLSIKDDRDHAVRKINKVCGLISHVRPLYPRSANLCFIVRLQI